MIGVLVLGSSLALLGQAASAGPEREPAILQTVSAQGPHNSGTMTPSNATVDPPPRFFRHSENDKGR